MDSATAASSGIVLRALPRNTRAIALVFEASRVHTVGAYLKMPGLSNPDILRMLSGWRRSVDTMPFLVAAGHITRHRLVGGLSADWVNDGPLALFPKMRLDESAREEFSSVWIINLDEPRRTEIQTLLAQHQHTAGCT